VLLALSTLTHQPDDTTDFRAYAEYVTTGWFLVSHLAASVLGAALGLVGAVALLVLLTARAGAARGAFAGVALFVLGQVLVASVFGVAAFQPAIGDALLRGELSAPTIHEDVVGFLFGVVQPIGGHVLAASAAVVAARLTAHNDDGRPQAPVVRDGGVGPGG
jgi:hypothetical protein